MTRFWVGLQSFWLLFPCGISAQERGQEVNPAVREFISSYCLKCHNAKEQNGDMRLDKLRPKLSNGADAQLWQDVLDIINIGDMPPEEADQPSSSELSDAIGLLTEDLLAARKRLADKGGEVVIRRMNELEYRNTVRSLTGVDVPEALVPDDESGVDFNTLGHYQTFSPAVLEQYEEAATYAISKILLEGNAPKQRREVIRKDQWKEQVRQKEKSIHKFNDLHEKAKKDPREQPIFDHLGFETTQTTRMR